MLRAEIKFQQGTQRDLQYWQRSPTLLEAITLHSNGVINLLRTCMNSINPFYFETSTSFHIVRGISRMNLLFKVES